jgi:cell division protease FtsH
LAGGGGMDFGSTRTHSEQTAREIDEEVKRILDEAIDKVKHILSARRPALEALTKRLMEKEVVEAIELRQLMEENSPGPHLVPGTTTERKRNVPIIRPEATTLPTVKPGEAAEG